MKKPIVFDLEAISACLDGAEHPKLREVESG